MTQGGFYETKRLSPTGLAAVVLLHGVALTALILAKQEITRHREPPIVVDTYDPEVPPPPKPEPKPETDVQQHRTVIETPTPIIQIPPRPTEIDNTPLPPVKVEWTPPGKIDVPIAPPPPPPPPAPRTIEPARAKANLASYVSDADYPSAAVRNEEQGTTRFRLVVTPEGRVGDCTVTGTSGSTALDAATCKIMRNRARFTPARDSSGKPTGDSVSSTIRWVLPED
jgi:protein TonB